MLTHTNMMGIKLNFNSILTHSSLLPLNTRARSLSLSLSPGFWKPVKFDSRPKDQ
jgi:hypothetical protein